MESKRGSRSLAVFEVSGSMFFGDADAFPHAIGAIGRELGAEASGATFAVQDGEMRGSGSSYFDKGFYAAPAGLAQTDWIAEFEARGVLVKSMRGGGGTHLANVLADAVRRHLALHGRAPSRIAIYSDFSTSFQGSPASS